MGTGGLSAWAYCEGDEAKILGTLRALGPRGVTIVIAVDAERERAIVSEQ